MLSIAKAAPEGNSGFLALLTSLSPKCGRKCHMTPELTDRKELVSMSKKRTLAKVFPLQFPPRGHQSLHRPAGKGWMEMLTHQTTYKRARCEASNLTCAFTPGANGLLRIADGGFSLQPLVDVATKELVVSLAFPRPSCTCVLLCATYVHGVILLQLVRSSANLHYP